MRFSPFPCRYALREKRLARCQSPDAVIQHCTHSNSRKTRRGKLYLIFASVGIRIVVPYSGCWSLGYQGGASMGSGGGSSQSFTPIPLSPMSAAVVKLGSTTAARPLGSRHLLEGEQRLFCVSCWKTIAAHENAWNEAARRHKIQKTDSAWKV